MGKTLDDLREHLLDKERFIPVFNYFLKKSVAEVKLEESDEPNELPFSMFYETYIDNVFRTSVDIVYQYSKSPIETITLNSLLLLFIRSSEIGLQITPPCSDFNQFTSDYRTIHSNIMSLAKDYVDKTGDKEFNHFESFFQKQIDKGRFSEKDYCDFEYHRIIVENFLWDSHYLTIQAQLPEVVVNKKGITVDLLFWKPSDKNFKLVVECDGFKWHKTQESFTRDRKRDRLLKANGYDVIRFSGSEIYHDPITIADEIYDYINRYTS